MRQRRRITSFLQSTDSFVYTLVGISFVIAAILSLCCGIAKFGYSLWQLSAESPAAIFSDSSGAALGVSVGASAAVINFDSDLLLTLINMEVMGTIVHYLRTRATSLKPFLFIGIISATQGILAVGARLSVTNFQSISPDIIRDSMIELGVNAGVIIALGL